MKASYFFEYLIIGSLYLIPLFVIYYTYYCFRLNKKLGFIDSIKSAYGDIPKAFKGPISLEMKNQNLKVIIILFFMIIVGTITNGTLVHLDNFWLHFFRKFLPNNYENYVSNHVYMTEIQALAKYNISAAEELIGKIRFQIIITRHGIAHSIIHIVCLIFIVACKNLTLRAKLSWIGIIIFAFFHAANGLLAARGWYEGVMSCILSL